MNRLNRRPEFAHYAAMNTKLMHCCVVIIMLCVVLSFNPALAQGNEIHVRVVEPYVPMHTGPGRGYPVFYIVERHESIQILKRKTDWFKAKTAEGKIGWISLEKMTSTLSAPGAKTRFGSLVFDNFMQRTYEMGISFGDFEGASVINVYGAFNFNEFLSWELSAAQASGEVTNTSIFSSNLVSTPFPTWRVSPFFTLGFGSLSKAARKNFIGAETTQDVFANAGFGLKVYLTRRFMLRGDLRHYVAFIDDDTNGEFLEWKIGVSFFY